MKAALLLILPLIPSTLLAQKPTAERNPWKAPALVVPEEVATARVLEQTVLKGGGSEGGDQIGRAHV